MQDLDPAPADPVPQLSQLGSILVVPSCRDGLEDETFSREAVGILSFLDFLSGKSITVSGKAAVRIGEIEECWAKETLFDFGKLDVGRFGDTGGCVRNGIKENWKEVGKEGE